MTMTTTMTMAMAGRWRYAFEATAKVGSVQVELVLTVIGADRPGLVEALSRTVTSFGANWEQSRMARLSGRFAGILRVTVEKAQAEPLAAALRGLEPDGLRVIVEGTQAPAPTPDSRRLRLELVGQDHTGIIRDISRALAERGVNVEELSTDCQEAPMGGGVLFRMSAAISAPASVALDDLRTTLESLANDLMVDIDLQGLH
jgi:glycine cleavage system regulatory protein